MYSPSQRAEQLMITDQATEDAELGTLSVYDAALLRNGEKGPAALAALNDDFTVDAIEARSRAAAEAQIDRNPGAAIKLSVRSDAMKRFVDAVNTFNQAKGAGAASSTPGSDFQTRYDNPRKVANSMERNAKQAEHDADIARRILTGEAALIAAGFDETYAMAVRVAIRDELKPLWETGPIARDKRGEAVKNTQYPKQ